MQCEKATVKLCDNGRSKLGWSSMPQQMVDTKKQNWDIRNTHLI